MVHDRTPPDLKSSATTLCSVLAIDHAVKQTALIACFHLNVFRNSSSPTLSGPTFGSYMVGTTNVDVLGSHA